MKFKINKETEKECQVFIKSVLEKIKTENNNDVPDYYTAALVLLEENYNNFLLCKNQIKIDGLTIKDRFGVLQKHPLLKQQTDSNIQVLKLLQEFGLTAKSGQRINTIEEDDNNPLSNFINK